MSGVQTNQKYVLSTAEFAKWIARQGRDSWWAVDGDPFLTGRLSFPCPGIELARELETISRTLLVQAPDSAKLKAGGRVTSDDLDKIVTRYKDEMDHLRGRDDLPEWADDRLLYLSWQDSPGEWVLEEDRAVAKYFSLNDTP